ncbi:MAG TPA: 2Fe-2S iron-sulfur cluster-binding protein [candidate division Zixibacteria bacterium]|nr:2Fe-2S iron-sulfur cluster-binding protein [candidate division Zixibacteria bacterium]
MAFIVIDGQEREFTDGTLLLDAIRRQGIELPTLCHWDGLPPYGACRLCLVEVTKGKSVSPSSNGDKPQIVAACTYPVEDGIEVKTTGSAALAVRQMMLEFMLARCPESEVIQELATGAGVMTTRFSSNRDNDELCVLCGLCVRVCRDLIGAAAIGFIDRGGNREVGTPFRIQSEACIGCGACVAVCPTGAVQMEDIDGTRFLTTWNTSVPLHTCPECGEPFAPEPMAFLKEQVPVSAESWGLCPKCRRQATLNQLDFTRQVG